MLKYEDDNGERVNTGIEILDFKKDENSTDENDEFLYELEIKVNGKIEKVDGPWKSQKKGYLDLTKCYKLINCNMIQLVPCRFEVPEGKYEIILDEEVRYNGAEFNHAASSIVGTQLGQIMPPIFGNVILCKAGPLK